ncbi:hypothetical protein EC957_003812 [Mortierella hygrophila]|uniref:Uncharacterized protein n=1 Tax=Mortierella hygrophila TaxID=979708 RepID=A0A9P6K6K5_9FUNG|nr:hypothetical protein EC957_003812 [Mortierella hygrophila]
MPAADSMTTMQPISGPIPVPGTQREPTTPPVSDIGAHLSNTTSSSGSSTPTNVVSPRTSVIGKSQTVNHRHHQQHHQHQRESSVNSTPSTAAHNQTHHNTHHPDHHHRHNNNANSGLRRFPSIGNTTKLNVENSTLRAKIIELERYLTGLKEELILAHRQVHAQRAEIKSEKEVKEVKEGEVVELRERVLEVEREVRVRTEECDGLRAQLQAARIQEDTTEKEAREKKKSEEVVLEEKATEEEQIPLAGAVATTEAPTTTTAKSSSSVDLDRIKALEEENARKDAQIKELLEKVDRLGTEVLNLERDKARLEHPLTPEPIPVPVAKIETAVGAAPVPKSATLESIVPITAAAIIAATTSQSASVFSGTSCSDRAAGDLTESASNNSLKSSSTSPSSVESDSNLNALQTAPVACTVNSVGYDFAVEHPKLLAKFQALRMQHAQASEYVDSLESENQDLKVQLLDVCAGSALVA